MLQSKNLIILIFIFQIFCYIIGECIKKNGTFLLRSKSVGSVVDVSTNGNTTGGITHQPSSLSLNNMESIESSELTCGLEPQS